MRNLQKAWHNAKLNHSYIAIGLVIAAIGLLLWTHHQYFFWPPSFKAVMNDEGLDAIGTFTGIGLIAFGLLDDKNNTTSGILLSVAAGWMGIIACIQFFHAACLRNAEMALGFIFCLFVIDRILFLARYRNRE